MLYLMVIQNEIHKPKRCALAHGCGLRRLKMRKAEARHVLIFISKSRNACNGVYQFFPDQAQRLAHRDHLGNIANIAAGCAQMDDRLRLGALIAVSVNVRHNIVAEFLFISSGRLVIDILGVRL